MGALKYIADKLFSNDQEVAIVETGAGIESGSGDNGSYTKFPDGTLMCWNYISDSATGYEKEYPIHFVGPSPSVVVTARYDTSRQMNTGWSNIDNLTHIRIYASAANLEGYYMAIGRWK